MNPIKIEAEEEEEEEEEGEEQEQEQEEDDDDDDDEDEDEGDVGEATTIRLRSSLLSSTVLGTKQLGSQWDHISTTAPFTKCLILNGGTL
ncbi:hypothetical protein M0802_001621 [Mischocyttarus mexicanus]|nr:hypothetical protein M0802_001621 [Mischocyttarus mexicanus]